MASRRSLAPRIARSSPDLSSLRYCFAGGSAMPVEVMKAFEKKYWESDDEIDGYTQMENNFSLFLINENNALQTGLADDREMHLDMAFMSQLQFYF